MRQPSSVASAPSSRGLPKAYRRLLRICKVLKNDADADGRSMEGMDASLSCISLEEARERKRQARGLVAKGIGPMERREPDKLCSSFH